MEKDRQKRKRGYTCNFSFFSSCYLVKVDNGKPVGLTSSHILYTEIKPLSVLASVQVKSQI